MREVARVLGRKEFRMSHEDLQWGLRFVNRAVTVGEDPSREDLKRCNARLADKKDVHVLAAFEKFKCDMLVTGDKELLRKVKGAETTKQAIEAILGES
jgi:predicted nucleic acid-binding protein